MCSLPDLDSATCRYCSKAFTIACDECTNFAHFLKKKPEETKEEKQKRLKRYEDSSQAVYCRNCGNQFKTPYVKKSYALCCSETCDQELEQKALLQEEIYKKEIVG